MAMTDQEFEGLIFSLRLQTISAPNVIMPNATLVDIIEMLEHFLTRIDETTGAECKALVDHLKDQIKYTPHIKLSADQIRELTRYLIEERKLANEIEEFVPHYRPSTDLFGKCTLQIYFQNEEDYQRWQEYYKSQRWQFDHTFPAIMRCEYEFQTTYDVDHMVHEIINLLQMGFDVRATDWKIRECKSQLKK